MRHRAVSRERRDEGFFARAMRHLRSVSREPLRDPVPDEPEVEARERYRLAGELPTPWLIRPGIGRWGYGLGAYGDEPDAYATPHAATIRSIARFDLSARRAPHVTTPEEEARLEYEFFHRGPRFRRLGR